MEKLGDSWKEERYQVGARVCARVSACTCAWTCGSRGCARCSWQTPPAPPAPPPPPPQVCVIEWFMKRSNAYFDYEGLRRAVETALAHLRMYQ